MLLVIDAGNTNVVFAIFNGDTIVGQWRISTDPKRTADEYGVWLTQVTERAGIKTTSILGAVLASVVPQAIFDLRQLTRRYFHVELMVIGDPRLKLKTGITVKIDNPNEVGADRLVNAFAAWRRYKQDMIVVDFGTATTFDVVNKAGDYFGGVIAPGVNLSLDALHRAAAKLPNVAIQPPEKVIGTSTIGAMQSGIYYGYAGMVETLCERIKKEFGKPMKVIATGGLASLYAKACTVIEQVEPDLTIYGLKELYEMNGDGAGDSAGNVKKH